MGSYGVLAQLVERRIRIAKAGGSTPPHSTKLPKQMYPAKITFVPAYLCGPIAQLVRASAS